MRGRRHTLSFCAIGLSAILQMSAAKAASTPSDLTGLKQGTVQTYQYKLPGLSSSKSGVVVGFPLISLPDARAAERINILLHHFLLGTLPPPAGTPTLPVIALAASEATNGLASLQVEPPKVLYQGRVLAVSAGGDGCGAYCESYERHFAFDARTGRLLVPAELFTPAGLKALSARKASLNLTTLQNAAGEARKALRGKKLSADDKERYEYQVNLYEECAGRYKEGGYLNDGINLGAMRLVEGGIEWNDERCSNHATRALDDLGDLKLTMSADMLGSWLSPYGRALLLDQGNAVPATLNGRAQIFKGSLQGPLPIVLIFGSEHGSLEVPPFSVAQYYYQKWRKPIDLKVERQGDQFTLTESGGVITAKLVGKKLEGQWRGNGKILAFEAEAF